MDDISNLISVLETEEELYNSLYNLLKEEVESIIRWQVDNIIEIGKRKNVIYCKESLLEEARKGFLKKIGEIYSDSDININKLIELLNDETKKETFVNLREKLLAVLEKIQLENTRIKLLYKNNIRIIDEFLSEIGIKEYTTYAKDKKVATIDNFTFIKNI